MSFEPSVSKAKSVLDYIHYDLWGSAKVQTHFGNNYFMSLIDDYTRKIWVYLLTSKGHAFFMFKEWKLLVENQTNKSIKTLRTDNGLVIYNNQWYIMA